MSLSSTLSAALSGLRANARSAQIVSSNLANATNESYARRSVELGATTDHFDSGVRVVSINRHVNSALVQDRRSALASMSFADVSAQASGKIADPVGDPSNPSSLGARLRAFEAALVRAEASPGEMIRLQDVERTARGLAQSFNQIEANIQTERTRADASIEKSIAEINDGLNKILTLNKRILRASAKAQDTSGYEDQRQALIDQVSSYVPLREIRHKHGAVSLVTAQGSILLDSTAKQFSFSPSRTITAHMTAQQGHLGQLKLGDETIDMSLEKGPLSGGKLQAYFDVRDRSLVEAQSDLDELAFVISEKLTSNPGDPSIAGAQPGILTDQGARASAATMRGLAGRLALNERVESASGGSPRALQAGLYAPGNVPIGDSAALTGLISAITSTTGQVAGLTGSEAPLVAQVYDFSSKLASQALARSKDLSFARADHDTLRKLQLSDGVNTDTELQKLMSIEKNYAANAQMIRTVDAMMEAVLRIVS